MGIREAIIWGHKPSNQSYQQFAEEGVAYFEKKYGHKPVRLEYRADYGEINVPEVTCMAVTANCQPGVILLFVKYS